MAFESLTQDRIFDLISCPKKVTNPSARSREKDGHLQHNYKVVAEDGSSNKFELYTRQNLRNGMQDDFSCGLRWIAPNGDSLTLKRYNGSNHNHLNHLTSERLGNVCHIHTATELYIKASKKPEGYAEATNQYNTLAGALHCLIKDCNISGLSSSPDITNQPDLFIE